ncbi:dormancy-associated protein 2-like isoform X1 [Vicia villosa]|uniref:dormancy-associated protein 2-like isoform X1 n=1 Tax=Vicia villosa TaxID=3911 RepID=UPI00273C49AF|nr:dormancy-associated protein 2-like isoform X1 [Vicia villosa]
MELKKAIILIPVLLAMVLLISSKVSARSLKVVEEINEINKASYVNGGYRGYPNNGGGYPGNGGGHVSSYYPGIGHGYGHSYYPGIGRYGGGYPINRGFVGGYNGGVVPGNIGGTISDIRSYIGGYINDRLRNGGHVGVQTEDSNTRN